jgi:hypothetical protein
MKLVLVVTTYINVSTKYFLEAFAQFRVARKYPRACVVSSQKLQVLTCLLLLTAHNAFCTTGIVIVTHDYLVIGADSAILHTGLHGQVTSIGQQCKILKESNTFYFIVGEYKNNVIGLDSYAIARQAILKSKTIEDALRAVQAPILAYIPKIVEFSKTEYPDHYARWLNGLSIINIVFASLEDGVPTAGIVAFKVDAKGVPLVPEATVLKSGFNQVQAAGLGSNFQMDHILDSYPAWDQVFLADPVGLVRRLVQAEIDESTRLKTYEVGPPISILWVGKDYIGFKQGYEGKCQ